MKKGLEKLDAKREKALDISIKEGSAASISTSVSENYITPFALIITPHSYQGIVVGILSSFSTLLSQISQYYGNKLMEHNSRKKIILKCLITRAFIWMGIALLAILSWMSIVPSYLPLILIALYCLVSVVNGVQYPAWFSWMGDLVPEKIRGKYFSRRGLITGIIGLLTVIVAGRVLDFAEDTDRLALGFTFLFLIASASKLVSYNYIKQQYAPKFKIKKEDEFSFLSFIKRMDNYGKFAAYQGFLNFAIMIASPFFAVYMLEQLHLDYFSYSLITIASTIFYLIFLPVAGKFSDKYGNLKLIYISSLFYAINPVLWMMITNPAYLILIQFAAGIANACIAIAITNFTYSSVVEDKRGTCIAYTNIFIGIGTFIGAMIGGFLLTYLSISASTFYIIFTTAAIARFSVMIIFLPHIKERWNARSMPFLKTAVSSPAKLFNMEYHSAHHFVEKVMHSRTIHKI